MGSFVLQKYEHVLCVQICKLKSNQDLREALKQYIIVGTGFMNGEDKVALGLYLIAVLQKQAES